MSGHMKLLDYLRAHADENGTVNGVTQAEMARALDTTVIKIARWVNYLVIMGRVTRTRHCRRTNTYQIEEGR